QGHQTWRGGTGGKSAQSQRTTARPGENLMAKNRKYQSAAVRFGPALKAFLLCVLLGGSGVGYVWQRSQIYELGRQITERETGLAALRLQNKKLGDQLH